MSTEEARVQQLVAALLAVDRVAVHRLLAGAEQALAPVQQVEQLVVPALERIGSGWEEGRISLSQVYVSGRLCEEQMDALLPPAEQARKPTPPLALAVLEDFHLLGLRLVYSTLRASGFAPVNYGRVALDPLVERVRRDGVRVLLVSTLMLPAALRVKDLTARLQIESPQTRVAVGGAPFRFDDQLWQQVGAHAMGRSASDAIRLVEQLSQQAP